MSQPARPPAWEGRGVASAAGELLSEAALRRRRRQRRRAAACGAAVATSTLVFAPGSGGACSGVGLLAGIGHGEFAEPAREPGCTQEPSPGSGGGSDLVDVRWHVVTALRCLAESLELQGYFGGQGCHGVGTVAAVAEVSPWCGHAQHAGPSSSFEAPTSAMVGMPWCGGVGTASQGPSLTLAVPDLVIAAAEEPAVSGPLGTHGCAECFDPDPSVTDLGSLMSSVCEPVVCAHADLSSECLSAVCVAGEQLDVFCPENQVLGPRVVGSPWSSRPSRAPRRCRARGCWRGCARICLPC
jgi:hypothetical protein